MNRREWLDAIDDDALRIHAAKFLDKIAKSGKCHERAFTAFLSPVEQDCFEKLFWQAKSELAMMCYGGYEGAEYQMIGITPDYMPLETADFPIALLRVKVTAKEHDLSHRDVLGSLMSLGFKRDRIGDLYVTKTGAEILCDRDMASYIVNHLERIGRYKVVVEQLEPERLVIPEQETERHRKTVSSLRLDAVLAAGFNLSRATALKLIESEKVKLNHLPETRSAKQIASGDLIACRGKGRILIVEAEGVTKKDRIWVTFDKMA